jgi:hypothetical protein
MQRNKMQTKLTCAAGEHYVAYVLFSLGYIAALTRDGVPGVDILACDQEGNRSLTIQVKATHEAGRPWPPNPPERLEFPLGLGSAKHTGDLLFAFVDLRWDGRDGKEVVPDMYLVPSAFVHGHCAPWVDAAKMVLFQIDIDKMAPFKNNWEMLKARLGLAQPAPPDTD